MIVLVIIGTLAARYLPETGRNKEMLAKIQDLETKATRKKEVLLQNERRERLLRTSPEYLSLIARDRLDLMQEGETLIRFESAKR